MPFEGLLVRPSTDLIPDEENKPIEYLTNKSSPHPYRKRLVGRVALQSAGMEWTRGSARLLPSRRAGRIHPPLHWRYAFVSAALVLLHQRYSLPSEGCPQVKMLNASNRPSPLCAISILLPCPLLSSGVLRLAVRITSC